MQYSINLISGLSLGVEYIEADDEMGVEFPCVAIDLFVFRIVIELAQDGR